MLEARSPDSTLEAMGRASGPTCALVPGVWVLVPVGWNAADGSAELRLNGWLEQKSSGLPRMPSSRTLALSRSGWPAVVDGLRVRPEAISYRHLVLDGLIQGPQAGILHP